MDTRIIITTLLISGIMLSGCVGSNNATTYLRDGGNVMYLMSDGTYIIYQPSGGAYHGEYVKVDDELFLKYMVLGTCEYFRMVWDKNGYVDHEGDRWVLEK